LVKILADANEDIRKYFENKEEKDKNGYVILETLKVFLSSFLKKDSVQNTKLHIDDPKLKNILEILKLTLQDERSGLGTYNLLFIAAELLNLRRNDYDGLKLGLIEEIEAHLHPQAQLRVVSALEDEAQKGGVQLIITTHSPNLASKIKIENLILCHGKNVYPLGSAYTELKPTDYTFLERFLDVTKANLFFAQGVILVEGDAENILIPTIAKLIDKDLTDHGVSVVNVGGTSFLRYGSIFKRQSGKGELKLPVAIITDLDVKPDDETAKKVEATKNKQAKYDGQSVKTFVSPHWTLEYCLALSANLRKLIFEAIKAAGQEMTNDGYTGKEVTDDWDTFSNGLSDTDLAKKIYELLRKEGKQISKAITAQYMASSLEKKLKDVDLITKAKEDEKIKYIVQAIEYATSNINN
jgi:putative ATP-dependent endonuclease of OLD family